MANILMSPSIAQMVPSLGLERKAQLPVIDEASFSQHLERQLQMVQEGANLLGAEKPSAGLAPEQPMAKKEVPVTVEAILQQLMVTLREVANQPGAKAEPGQWNFQLQDMGLLENLATQAGMDPSLLAGLSQEMKAQGGLPLADLFSALEQNFRTMDTATKVVVPETYLPLLETLLSKIGVAPELIQQLDSKGVNGTDQLDLIAFQKALNDIPKPQAESATPCVLSPWEFEQFTAMLSEAGVPSGAIEPMFPEKVPLWQKALTGLRPEQGDSPVTMTLDRLQSLLKQAIAAVDQARPKANPQEFFNGLGTVLSQTGFTSNDVGWSPVVQGTMKAAYEALQKLVDQGQVGEGSKAIAQTVVVDQPMARSAQLGGRGEQGQVQDADIDKPLSTNTLALLNTLLAQLVATPKTITSDSGEGGKGISQFAPTSDLQGLDPAKVAGQELDATLSLTPPVAELSLLQTLLKQITPAPEVVSQAASQGPQGINQSDLMAVLHRLHELAVQITAQPNRATVTLGQEELDQFATMLAEAGVPAQTIEAILPERVARQQASTEQSHPLPPLTMPLHRVTELLQQATAAVDEAQLPSNPVAFLQVQSPIQPQVAEPTSAAGAVTPVAPEGMGAIVETIAQLPPQRTGKETKPANHGFVSETIEQASPFQEEADAVLEVSLPTDKGNPLSGDSSPNEEATLFSPRQNETEKFSGPTSLVIETPSSISTEAAIKAPPRLHLTPELQQLTVEQITQGVLRSIKNSDHHLTLTLYPKELGEVKVDIQMRGNQLSASFVMENHKVKEAMESNMGEFKENLERRGFSLGEMSVSVGGQNHSDDSRQRFVAAWEQMQANLSRETVVTPTASPLEFIRQEQAPSRQGGISVFV